MNKNIFSPYATWKNFFLRPTTIRYPKEDLNVFDQPGAAPTYRGMHSNDLETCVGCGTCEDICPTDAITMIEGPNTGEGKKGVLPKIDYGRCCFCGFCVDVCTSSSLSMSRDYIYTVESPPELLGDREVETKARHFMIRPDDTHADNRGFNTPDELTWLDLDRMPMEEEAPETRVRSFMEIVKGFSREAARKEASRCVECGICEDACPAHMEIPQYIRAIWEDDLAKAVDIMYNTNPLPGICGRICTHKCETVCSISLRGEPLAIRWLKRYAVDMLDEETYKQVVAKEVVKNGQKVAIVGSGPSGLSAAWYLSLAGYEVTVFEALSMAGGMMRVGVPKYRLPHQAIDRDINHILSLGAELKLNTRVGKDITLEQLRDGYDAVYISTGLHLGRNLGFAAEKLPHVVQSIDMLREFILTGEVPVEERIVVIGGGNVAMDIARTMARLQKEKYGEVKITLLSLESEAEMPCDREEFVESQEEGVTVMPGYGPKDIVVEDGRVKRADFIRCLSVFDEQGRFSPKFNEDERIEIEADLVIESIGQASDISYIDEELMSALEKPPRGRIKVDEETQGTSIPWLFAGGDIIKGPDAINGIADGHRAAKGIDEYLSKKREEQ